MTRFPFVITLILVTLAAAGPGCGDGSKSGAGDADTDSDTDTDTDTDSDTDTDTDTDTETDSATDTSDSSYSTDSSSSETDTDTDTGTEVDPYLHIDGVLLKNAANEVVQLRGVNLGGWLVTENWMNGVTDAGDPSGRFTLETLEARFGATQANTLMEIWRQNFITTDDLDQIASLGFNVIRVPFGFRNLQHADGSWIRDGGGSVDFGWMDWIVNQARARGLYVLFDYHIWHGQQNDYEYLTCGPDEPRRQSERADSIALWTEVINHFRSNGTVAAFELINEACGGTWGAIFLYEALRALDPNRLFLIWGDPMENTRDWENVLYGPHEYDLNGPTVADDLLTVDQNVGEIAAFQADYNVPYFAGEFHVFTGDGNASMEYLLSEYAAHNIGWTKWTYKGVNVGGWAIVNFDTSVTVNAATDSYDTIAARWASLQSAGTYESTELKTTLSTAAGL